MVSLVSSTEIEPKQRILKYSRERFWESGFSKVTMDELAYELGMSKKTLYVHFPNKREMVRESLLGNLKEIEAGLKNILNDSDSDFLENLRSVLMYLNRSLPKPGRVFFLDMKRHARDIWLEIDQERLRIIKENFGRLLGDGVNKGLLRPTIDVDLLITALLSLIQQLVNPEVLSKSAKTPAEAFEEVFDILFIGILTDQGRNQFQETIAGE